MGNKKVANQLFSSVFLVTFSKCPLGGAANNTWVKNYQKVKQFKKYLTNWTSNMKQKFIYYNVNFTFFKLFQKYK